MAQLYTDPVQKTKTPISVKHKKAILVSLLLLVIIFAGLLFAYEHHKNTGYKSYTVVGQGTNSGIKFDMPAKSVKVLSSQTNQLELANLDNASKAKFVVIAATTHTSAPTYTSAQLSYIAKILSNSRYSNYQQFAQSISSFVSARMPVKTSSSLEAAKPFSNPNIKSNAWQFSFTDSASTSKSTPAEIEGVAVYAITNHGIYYFVTYTPASSWQQMQPAWKHVLDSIKVDQ
jgi:hypothetical protein